MPTTVANVTPSVGVTSNSRCSSALVKSDRADDTSDRPDRRDHRTVADHHHQDVARGRAQRQPDADVARSLAHQARHHAVDADAGETDRERGENGEQDHRKPAARQRLVDALRHRAHVVERQIGRDRANLAGRFRRQRGWIAPARMTTFIARDGTCA